MHTRAEQLWAKDIDQIERSYLGGMSVTNLPPRISDGRTPSQGTVLRRYTNIDQIVAKPSWLTVVLTSCSRSISGGSK
jgi:hypothetical protein